MAVRKDLSHPQQTVQACHAVIEAVKSTPPKTDEHPNVIVCAVRDETRLISLASRLARDGIAFQVFSEPDMDGQATALATEIVRGDRRRAFRNLQLLSAQDENKGDTMETQARQETATEQGTYKTRWGHVAYSYKDYLKLKKLHKIWFKALRDAARWKRWVRKFSHNRVLRRTLRDAEGRKIGREIVGSAPEPRTCNLFSRKLVDADRKPIVDEHNEYGWFLGWIETDKTVAVEYRKAKHPKADAAEVGKAGLTGSEIDTMLAAAEEWLAG